MRSNPLPHPTGKGLSGTYIQVFPKLDDARMLRLFYQGAKAQWTSQDLDWGTPVPLDRRQSVALARLITPVYLGEQSAMMGASSAIQMFMRQHLASYQVYLASFMMDEARHFESLTRLYGYLDHNPVALREMPEMLRYHHRMRLADSLSHWVWGILISDLFAKHFYRMFSRSQPEAVFGQIASRVLLDEARHQAFAESYLRTAVPKMQESDRHELVELRDDLLRIMDAMRSKLDGDCDALGIDGQAFFDRFSSDVIERSRKIGIDRSPGEPLGGAGGVVMGSHGPARASQGEGTVRLLSSCTACGACFVSRLVRSLVPPSSAAPAGLR